MSMDKFKQWLEQNGFNLHPYRLRQPGNIYDWLAAKRLSGVAECETNGYPQIVVKPYGYLVTTDIQHESVEIEITGERNKMWFCLKAYSVKPQEALQRWPEIERSLIAAWQAIRETNE